MTFIDLRLKFMLPFLRIAPSQNCARSMGREHGFQSFLFLSSFLPELQLSCSCARIVHLAHAVLQVPMVGGTGCALSSRNTLPSHLTIDQLMEDLPFISPITCWGEMPAVNPVWTQPEAHSMIHGAGIMRRSRKLMAPFLRQSKLAGQ